MLELKLFSTWNEYFIEYFMLRIFGFKINLFNDCDTLFLYIHLGKRWWRFGQAGYMSWKD